MKKLFRFGICIVISVLSILSTFSQSASAQIDPEAALPIIHTVYTLSNATNNSVLRLLQREGKPFRQVGFATGGSGTGTFLDAPAPLALSPDGRFLVAVNPGSNNVSLFSVNQNNGNLTLTGQPAGTTGAIPGIQPIGVAISSTNKAYVLFAGFPGQGGSITAFSITSNGLVELSNAARSLSTNAQPFQIAVSPNNDLVVVTERTANVITAYSLDSTGRPGFAIPNPTPGISPLGITFNRLGFVFSADSVLGNVNSYFTNPAFSSVTPVSRNIKAAGQEGTARVVATFNSRFVYASNPLSRSISRFDANTGTGAITVGQAVAAQTDQWPFDLGLSPRDGSGAQFLYSLNRASLLTTAPQTIQLYRVNQTTGALTFVTTISGIPFTCNGLAARL
ncbi:MAG: beta-propeller fold lactonase family protein [Acidobacteria bacterium]|nr:beta-propeller fold lactonase family protein [Acidobacteriota bacterium]